MLMSLSVCANSFETTGSTNIKVDTNDDLLRVSVTRRLVTSKSTTIVLKWLFLTEENDFLLKQKVGPNSPT